MATSPTCIIAYTSEDGRYTRVARAAIEIARASNASLILYDSDAATSKLDQALHPLSGVAKPTEWDGEGAKEVAVPEEHRMGPEELERSGRGAIAEQVMSARGSGIRAFGWLPDKKGIEGLNEYAEEQGADLLVVPEDIADAGFFSKFGGKSLEEAVEKVRTAIAVVGEDGSVEYPQHEPEPEGEAESLREAERDRGK